MAKDQAYLEAEKKIKEALLSGAKDLNLSNMDLTELPELTDQLTQLQSINLSHNKLIALPNWLWQITQLQMLDISSNQLTTLPDALGNLTQLRLLYAADNRLTSFPEAFGNLKKLRSLVMLRNQLVKLPEFLGQLTELEVLDFSNNQLIRLPMSLGQLADLRILDLSNNHLRILPESFDQLIKLIQLYLPNNQLLTLPEHLGRLTQLQKLELQNNKLTDLPASLVNLENFNEVVYDNYQNIFRGNFFSPELTAAFQEGLNAFKRYLNAKSQQVILNEAKLILIGEGEVGKSCLLSALRGDAFVEGLSTTHGIEIKPVKIIHPDNEKEIILNGWDFGGQRVYRPTHQLFFSAPAVYLVVWKPREGPQQGFVKEWIKLVKHREPDAKILVVATHGGPQQRQPDIDRQELWDLFGKGTVIDFFFVESKPDEKGERRGIEELKNAIARVASVMPEVGRCVPKSFQEVSQALQNTGLAYLPLERVHAICHEHKMDDELARLFVSISHRLGHLIHYEHDPALQDIVVLKPNWLASAISFVLDDEVTRINHGIISFDHLESLWNDPIRDDEHRYKPELHPLFLRLMERFDLSYKVLLPTEAQDAIGLWQQIKGFLNNISEKKVDLSSFHYTSLIGQLVPDNRPEKDLEREWSPDVSAGDIQQVQICRIVDVQNGQSASAEGLFYQLIVRLHKYSLGREDYIKSVHWQRGLVLDDDYNGRALLEHVGNDVRITVRAPYPERFLAMLTSEIKYLVESFWEGLRCDVMVPCIHPCGRNAPGTGLFQVEKLIKGKRNNQTYPCPVCDEWQDIDSLLRNAPAAQPDSTALIFAEFSEVKAELAKARQQISYLGDKTMGRFNRLDDRTRRTLSRVDKTYTDLIQIYTDEAKEGPRLFSFVPVNRTSFNPRQWTSAKFCLTLWCEHSRLPLPALNSKDRKKGVYDIELTHEWFKKAGPYLKLLTGTLSLVLPVASSAIKLELDEKNYKAIEEQLDFGKNVIGAIISEGAEISKFMGEADTGIYADGATLRELHALLKAKDPGFGGLVRVLNKRQEFMWVHERFASEY